MKRAISALMCLLLMFSLIVVSGAQEEFPTTASPSVEDYPQSGIQWQNINSVNVTFYVVNNTAYVAYFASAKINGVSVKVQVKKNAVFSKIMGESGIVRSDKKYLSGAYSAPADGDGTYYATVYVTVGNNTVKKDVAYVYSTKILKGDANSDGVIQANDARLVLRYSAGLDNYNSEQKNRCDISQDGSITATDARIILRISAELD